MKKTVIFLIFLLMFTHPSYALEDLAPNAKSAFLMEASTGKVIYEKNSEEKLYPASMTKMMSLILVYEAINKQQLKLDEFITISENAASMGGSQIFLQPNEQMSVSDLLKAICISSANDAMVALAEKISGSVSEFVDQMNDLSKEMGLVNTNFMNTTGLHDDNHYSCAKDMGMIAKRLLEVGKEDLLKITSTYEDYVRQNTENPFWLVNTNKLVKYGEGVDGLKTGFTSEALSCITVTAKKDHIRLISVVMKEPDSKTRNKEVMEMLQVGFSRLTYQSIYKKNDIYIDHYFEFGLPHQTQLYFMSDVGIVLNKDEKANVKDMIYTQTKKELPLEKNEKIGEVKIMFDNNTEYIVDVGVSDKIEKMSFLDMMCMTFWRVLT